MRSNGWRRRLNLLLVDDSVEHCTFLEQALEDEFVILTATRGAEGLTLAQQAHPDAIVLDINMPGLDGWETCTELKSNAVTADIPVILLTGATGGDLSQHARAVGASAILRKPCPIDTLRASILLLVDGSC